MTKTVEYRVIPFTRWHITRFERDTEEGRESSGCEQRGEFENEKVANEVASLLARAEEGAAFNPRKALNRPA